MNLARSLRDGWQDSVLRRSLTLTRADQSALSPRLVFFRLAPPASVKTKAGQVGRMACVALLVSCALLPKWQILPGAVPLFIRPEDLFLVLLLLCIFLAGKFLQASPMDRFVALFLLVVAISIMRGTIIGTVATPLTAILYLMKIVQYFMTFYAVLSLVESRADIASLVRVMIACAMAVALYALLEYWRPFPHPFHSAFFYYRGFERGLYYREANHMAAFLMFSAALCLGLTLEVRRRLVIAGLSVAFILMVVGMSLSYSRTAYVALASAVAVAVALRYRWRGWVSTLIILSGCIVFAPSETQRRLLTLPAALIGEDSSMIDRFGRAQKALSVVPEFPLLGVGVGARNRAFYENVYVWLISEAGIIGLLLYLVIIVQLYVVAVAVWRRHTEGWCRGFALGYVAGLTGLLMTGNTLVVFLLTRVATPFWFATGLLVWLWQKDLPDRESPAISKKRSGPSPTGPACITHT
ncbi:MAG: O-antigen ligase family protein [Verrucomicrobia bacterium]|nr:O-antigen ligase family protein [Verrucomicrobiota bacterium]